ncbi:T9SS type A sorting domain-containing protein [Saccharicrinis aurantiacus]|uniref:T9SS type A sorting domain-containing protein n=1 Tax=Saccharicrinis aurantiacus TaxID=1849719 RepID=UPI00249072A9|nr:T9SS type A sorting domain-containing protein [Saccharicrinis aurantiacus]
MKTKLLFLAFLGINLCYSQTLVFPLSNGGSKDQGTVFKYDYSNGNHEAIFFDHEVEKSDHRGIGSTNRESKGTYVSSNSCIYYTFAAGGTHAYDAEAQGQIIKYDLTTEEFSVVRSFSVLNYEEGSEPTNGLTEYNGKLYGVCRVGGVNDNGVIYYIDLTDDSYHVVHEFLESTDGAFPNSSLILETNKLYGGTRVSTDGNGFVLYEFDPSNNNYSVLSELNGWGVAQPINDLIFKSGLLYYCSSSLVGYYNFGLNTLNTVHQSTGTNDVLGNFYQGFNFSSNTGKHYVTASGGGSNSKGAILELNSSAPQLVNVHSFGANGVFPQQELIDLGNGKQAGVTLENATDNHGSLFEFSATNIETPIFSFPNTNTDGYRIQGIPVLVNNVLYGFADEGGANGSGVFYKYDLLTSTYSKIKDMGSSNGRTPIGQILPTGTGDYLGLNARGGGFGYGTIFSSDLNSITGVYDNIDNNIIEEFETNLVLFNGLYYGVGAAYDPNSVESFSVLFSYDPVGSSISLVAAIDPSGIAGVALPTSISEGNLLLEGNKLYGFTAGKIFEYNLDMNAISYPHTFNTSIDGNTTFKAEIDNGVIYGINNQGGANGTGAVFQFEIGNSTFSVLEDFTSMTGNPVNLALVGVYLYGITSSGGVNDIGSVFKYDLLNNMYSTIHDLDSTEGYYRGAKLFLASDDKLYGTLDEGGQNGYGSIIKIDPTLDVVSFPFHFTELTGNTTLRSMITEINSSLSINEFDISDFKVFPNPVKNTLNVELNNINKIEIYSTTGNLIKSIKNSSIINVADISSGILIIKVYNNDGIFSSKFIKE